MPHKFIFVTVRMRSKNVKIKNQATQKSIMHKHILVVDDSRLNQMVLKVIINDWSNTKTSFASNGAEGLELLKNHSIDLVLMDLRMPVMDGYATTIAIRNDEAGIKNSKIPIIAVTSEEIESTLQRTIEIGMNDFMNKPIDKAMLYQKVKMWLQ